MKADGTIVQCSRTENDELFSLALGGYGLFGVILDVDLQVTANERYRLEQHRVPVSDMMAVFEREITDRDDVEMAYARMDVVPDDFLKDVIVNLFVRDPEGEIPALVGPGLASLKRVVFRGSADSDYGKALRWAAESRLEPMVAAKVFSRNQLLNEGVEIYQNCSKDSTDILHEYFVPRDQAVGFVEASDVQLCGQTREGLLTVRFWLPERLSRYMDMNERMIDSMKNTFAVGLLLSVLSIAPRVMADTAVVAGGCFWCVESDFEKLEGVSEVVSGFTGGTLKNPTYNGNHQGHYEAVAITYDPEKLSYEKLLDYFWRHIDPFDGGGQFCDRGPSYLSAIFVANEKERGIAEASKKKVEALFPKQKVVTPILDAKTFYPIQGEEAFHQDYYKNNPVRYNSYRKGCGRDRRVQEIWGDAAGH